MSGLSWGGGIARGFQSGGRGPGENENKRCEKLLKFNRIKN